MPSLPGWVLPVLLFVVWCLWALAAIVGLRARELRRGTPKEQRGGVSILPVIPLFPMVFWGVAWVADRWFAPWGTLAVGVAHTVLAAAMLFALVRDLRFCLRGKRSG